MTTQAQTYPEQTICTRCGEGKDTTLQCIVGMAGGPPRQHSWATLSPDTRAQPLPAQPDTYYEAVRELRDRLAWHQDTLDTLRRSIEEHAAAAADLEDQCAPVQDTIASIRALIALAGGTA